MSSSYQIGNISFPSISTLITINIFIIRSWIAQLTRRAIQHLPREGLHLVFENCTQPKRIYDGHIEKEKKKKQDVRFL